MLVFSMKAVVLLDKSTVQGSMNETNIFGIYPYSAAAGPNQDFSESHLAHRHAVGVWAIAAVYIPIFGSFLSPLAIGLVTALIVLLAAFSLIGHVLVHVFVARRTGNEVPPTLSVWLFGDAAQSWPASKTSGQEALTVVTALLFNAMMAGLAYLIWNAQLNVYLNLTMLLLCGFNIWLVMINLIPAFPLDGGRLVRAILQGLVQRPAGTTQLGLRFGYVISIALIGWGIFLIVQHSRFSWETGATTIAFAILILAALRMQPAWKENDPAPVEQRSSRQPIRTLIAGMLILSMLGITSSLLLINNGLEAPGFALAVEPMVRVAPDHLYTHSGSLILTSVVAQAPIIAGEWAVGQVSLAVKIVPPASIVPENTTLQEQARQGFRMLDESVTTAIVVGLRRAGYSADLIGKGVKVLGIQSDSHAQGVLQAGDVITGLNGLSIRTPNELIDQIKAQNPQAIVHLNIVRDQRSMEVAAPLITPTITNTSPRLGIAIGSAGADVQLPFPVQIVPEKIVGGPSAGLMFTLAVYNAVTPTDITGGRKIAGTGTISLDGSVGPIGGVEQKVAAAEAAGAEYFLSPVENYDDARAVARQIKVVKVATVDQALAFLRGLSQ
jgi:PDZ domain-containing protein